MKKLFVVIFAVVIFNPLFSQASNNQITDYFPISIGNSWIYANASGKTTDVVMLKNSMPDPVTKDGTTLYLFEHQHLGIGTTSILYSIKENKVLIMITKNILGQNYERKAPYPVELAPAGQEWRYDDRGDDYRLKTSRAVCSFDDKTYNDCILVEERIVDDNRTLRTKKSYYAKGIGLVYVTLQEQGEKETVYQKLMETNVKVIEKTSDYFPAKEGYRWEYTGTNGKVTDVYTCVTIKEVDNNQTAAGFFQTSLGRTTKVLYSIVEDTGVYEASKTDSRGELTVRDKFIPVLSLYELKWKEEDRGDVFQCQSKKTSVSFDDKTYSDCIMVEKAIFINNRPLMTKRQYFARGIGLVYVTLQGQGDVVEKPYLRLSSHNF
ncbi:MAG: hypothetical protein LBH32_13260 [Dysgonamonadaceae bacterium]|jgi:hypothetical protein|nr:hypothetical protein [Dysgonamonadaceae bacterium]